MSAGLILKSVRESWLSTLLFSAGMLVTVTFVAFILPKMYAEAPGLMLEGDTRGASPRPRSRSAPATRGWRARPRAWRQAGPPMPRCGPDPPLA